MGKDDQGSLTVGRREVLRGAAILAVPFAPALSGCTTTDDAPASEPFRHGIASGDPLPDGVLLWTRVSGGDGAPLDAE
jgi:alkaline phosphatase D